MYLQYGSYTHALGEARVTIMREALKNAAGDYYAQLERWDIDGRLTAADASALSTAITALEAAYASGGYDLKLLLPDGVTASSHQLLTANCEGGTKIAKPVSYPVGAGAEYSTFRTYSLSVEGEIPLAVGQNPIVEWRETLAFTGNGGPRFVVIECRNGPPQVQQVSQQTPARCIQSGRAVGYQQYPFPPSPIWPVYEQRDLRQINLTSPETSGSGAGRTYQNYEISWSYSFLAPVPLSGFPNPQP